MAGDLRQWSNPDCRGLPEPDRETPRTPRHAIGPHPGLEDWFPLQSIQLYCHIEWPGGAYVSSHFWKADGSLDNNAEVIGRCLIVKSIDRTWSRHAGISVVGCAVPAFPARMPATTFFPAGVRAPTGVGRFELAGQRYIGRPGFRGQSIDRHCPIVATARERDIVQCQRQVRDGQAGLRLVPPAPDDASGLGPGRGIGFRRATWPPRPPVRPARRGRDRISPNLATGLSSP